MKQNRRNFLKKSVALTCSPLFVPNQNSFFPQAVSRKTHISGNIEVFINQYAVGIYYAREGINFTENLDRCFAEMKEAGLAGFEAIVFQPDELDAYIDAIKKQNMQLRSFYTSGNLHDEAVAETEIKRALAIAERSKVTGAKVVVFNPQPKSGKSDAELDRQNQNLDILGAELRKRGMTLAMHYHTTELEYAAREFHGFMCNTDPKNVSLCLDAHWSYRASNNSAISAYTHAKLYADRVAELHLRQSQDGVWTETFMTKSDLDYNKILAILHQGNSPADHLVVLEQTPENNTPKTLKPFDIFKQSVEAVKKMYKSV